MGRFDILTYSLIFFSWESVIQKDAKINDDQCTQSPLIRVVVRKETNFQNRKTLFDSSCVKRNLITAKDSNKLAQYDEIANQYGYKVMLIIYNQDNCRGVIDKIKELKMK